MGKIGRASGPSRSGVTPTDVGDPVLVRGERIRITDGAIELYAALGDAAPAARIYLDRAGVLQGTTTTAAWVFDVTEYGAAGDGATDDTAAIQAAIDAAYAYAAANESSYAEVYFPPSPTPYLLSSATTTGGTTLGNAQLTIPIQLDTARKLTLVFRGAEDAASMPWFEQTTGNTHRWGVTLKSTLTGLTSDAAWGAPSVIGGPAVSGSSATYGSSSSNFNNITTVFRGIGISVPLDPTIAGFDMRGQAQARFDRCGYVPDALPSAMSSTVPQYDTSFGFGLPQNFNNDRNMVLDCSVYGAYYGFITGEHLWMDRSASIYCNVGVFVQGTSENIHGNAFGSISIEACNVGFTTNGGDSYGVPIHVAMCSFETIANYHIDDNSNSFAGTFNIVKLDGPTGVLVRGATNLRIVNMNQDLGSLTPPSVPATTVAHTNVFYVDCDVYIVSGAATITQVDLDGVDCGIAADGLYRVRSGGTIALTYTGGTPTWTWFAR